MEEVWVLRDWAKILISQRFCSSLWMESGIRRRSQNSFICSKRFCVLPCAEQMGASRDPHAGSGQTALVRLELSGA